MKESDKVNFIHEFWLEMCPFFSEYEFIYYELDVITIVVMLEIMLLLPSYILFGGTRRLTNKW